MITQTRFIQNVWVRALLTVGRIGLGSFFLYAALSKFYFDGAWHLRDYQYFFAMAIDSYKMLPFGAVVALARVLPCVELIVGLLVMAGFGLRWIGPITIALLLIFLTALVHAKLQHLDIVCGCTGGNETVEVAIARDLGLLALAIAATIEAFLSKKRQGTATT